MSEHPLLDLLERPEIRQVKGFRALAENLSGAELAAAWAAEREAAPRLDPARGPALGSRDGTLPGGRRKPRDEELLAAALWNAAREREKPYPIARGGSLRILGYRLPLESGREQLGIGPVDLLGVMDDDRLAVVELRYVPPPPARGSASETPLRALVDALLAAAAVEANREALAGEVEARLGRPISSEPPAVLLVAGLRYWDLARRREVQKGAAWIREMERLAAELEAEAGISVRYLGLELAGPPAWEVRDGRPVLTGVPRLVPAWEYSAGKPKPKARARQRKAAPEPEPRIEADPSRAPRPYDLHEHYQPGDTLLHPQLGTGVVQSEIGASKIEVRFGDDKRLLVHRRPPRRG